MSLLEFEHVCKRGTGGGGPGWVLQRVSLELERGEYVVVWGARGCGRSTLLRIAAGIESPDSGAVRFEGHDMRAAGVELGEGIGYCLKRLGSGEGRNVLDQMLMGLLARGTPQPGARSLALAALERCELLGRSRAPLADLDGAERVRLAVARALASAPRLLIIDEPANGVELIERDGILLLLRSLADEGITVLASASEPTSLSGADRTLALSDGELRGEPSAPLATVLPLHATARRLAAG
ncbi:MAG TPA: ATP-binding cassette domain-containing protein [Solirubrobacteraceae bacterium]|jgi:ABC-type sugar transport system ATPase subunit|nr:ATP-binding cassette domain-containing protein [Solirubrobacteraceae bacterium]